MLDRFRERRNRAAGRAPGRPPRDRVVFVVSGGGVLGAVQVGMLRELEAAGVRADAVIGCSVGSLNAAMYASGTDAACSIERLSALWVSLQGRDLFPSSSFSVVSKVLRGEQYLHSSLGLTRMIEGWLEPERFDQLRIPLRVVATDVDAGTEVVFAAGPLKPALLASCAIPGVYPIVEHGGLRLIDGGTVNTAPLSHADWPDTHAYLLHAGGRIGHKELRGQLDVLTRAFAIARSVRLDVDLERLGDRVTPISVTDIDVSPSDMSHTRTLIELGAAAARRVLDDRAPTPTEEPRRLA